MTKVRFSLKILAFIVLSLACVSAAQAQATRTWVSGVGDDVNPCSRTAPCKTFAGAISKTADGGEIDALDPGGFGAVLINKSVTLEGAGTLASILASGVNGITVNDGGANAIVVSIHNILINGGGTGLSGISLVSGRELNVENCNIFGFGGNGPASHGLAISLSSAANQRVHVTDTIIRDNTGNGINVSNTGGSVNVTLDNVRISDSNNGLISATNGRVNARNSTFNNNAGAGVGVLGGSSVVDLEKCGMQGNITGLAIAASVTRISDCRITNNNYGINFGGGVLQTYGDNKVDGNNVSEVIGGSIPSPINKR